MMWSCISVGILVVVSMTGCGSSGLDFLSHDGTNVDRGSTPDRSLVEDGSVVSPTSLDVSGAGDTRLNGVYKVSNSGKVWKNQKSQARIYQDTFGAGNLCLNAQVWWMGYDKHGRYFNCFTSSVPPRFGWNARNFRKQPLRQWSNEYGDKSLPNVQSGASLSLQVSGASETRVNGVYQAEYSGNGPISELWVNRQTGAQVGLISIDFPLCPTKFISAPVWWMWYREDDADVRRYYSCDTGTVSPMAPLGELPPMSGWGALVLDYCHDIEVLPESLRSSCVDSFVGDESSPQVRFSQGQVNR